ncbi:alpha/beta hydrolase [Rhodopirellula sp. MGV]|uniref:alpha/beta hydrolase n=1 Tax=Rhodopirellula sp. MGV TaxID=2023130 RepID=UPI000B978086|nr:alpha/beta hydrolase [Rhodopirellula sp. MGV]OYP33906.1 alpha/beta hydrolase [Rhodopirellula sp. MGV]PNY34112.1 alpha/beta hydrolase [Rhodopirellula baltica]
MLYPLVLTVALIASVLCAAECPAQGSGPTLDEVLLFHPVKYPEGDWSARNVVHQDVYFTAADQTKLHGWYCPVDDPRAVVLWSHGNAGNIALRTQWLRYLQSELKVAVFLFDYRGYGKSEGKPTVRGALQDAEAARAKLRELAKVNDRDIVLMGESLGGAIAVQLAANSPPRAIILQSTFSSLRDVATVHFPKLAWLVPKAKLDSESAIANCNATILQSHGTEDRTIPLALGKKLYQAAKMPKRFVEIEGANHNDWLTNDYIRQLDQFLADLPASGVKTSGSSEK